jgi:phosphate/sulfate permease
VKRPGARGEVMRLRTSELDHARGLVGNLTTAFLVLVASRDGHAGVDRPRRLWRPVRHRCRQRVRWAVVRRVASAWGLALSTAAAVGALLACIA